MSVIEATELRKSFRVNGGGVEVLRGVDVTIHPGEFIALLGPSGSGKSTLLHILGLMDRATSGTLTFSGRDVAAMDKGEMADMRRRELGFVFQTFNLLPTLNASANVELPMRLAGVPTRERRNRARDLLAQVGLEDRLKHHPSRLSGGERQRVAIARALANNPKIVMADEPTGNLDSEATHTIMEELARAHQRGVTLMIVTHNPEVASYANRVLRMRDGALSEVGYETSGVDHRRGSKRVRAS